MSDTHVLVIGHPRGGTSVLFNMICAAWPELGHAQGESAATAELAIPGDRVSKRPLDSSRRATIVTAAHAHGKRLLVVQIVRDPRDVLTSRFIRGGYAVWPECYIDRMERRQPALGYMPIYYGLAEWRHTHDPIIVLRYEDLVRDPLAQQRRVEQALGREATGLQFEFFHEAPHLPMTAGARDQRITGAFVGRWRNPEHADRVRDIFGASRDLRAAVVEVGYERDDGWLKEIMT